MESVSTQPHHPAHKSHELSAVTIRFCGDSGDGMQFTGSEFTRVSALAGNDLQTLPDYPAEIRAPVGTLAGVSGFQVQFSSAPVFTPGDAPEVLVAMNPAALKSNLADLVRSGTLILNSGAFTKQNLDKAGYTSNPMEDGSLAAYRVHAIDISKLTATALADTGLSAREIARAKNMFALGLMLWMYSRPMEATVKFLEQKFAKMPDVAAGNVKALKAGYYFGETAEIFTETFVVRAAELPKGTYRSISGNEATALGLVATSELSGLKVFLGTYPITPASDILHELSKHRNFNVNTFQAEDEIAAVCASLGASFGGSLGVTSTSGPGVALMQETISLALTVELPMLVINVQRGGPSTGLPTKTEQADLLQAIFGRNGEAPLPVLAASGPADCFDAVLEAARVAIRHMTPVILLTDGFIANGQEPWKLPEAEQLAKFAPKFRTDPKDYHVYERDPKTLARAWVRPGTPGLEHRIGGLEKHKLTGNVSYDPDNHEEMVRTRAEKVARVADDIAPLSILGPKSGDVLVLGWGSTCGAIQQAVQQLQAKGHSISAVHLRHLNPLPKDLGEILARFKKVVIPELNLGQLQMLVRARYLVDAQGIHKIKGKPFRVSELKSALEGYLS
ncbi:MAG: 2-oxoacid:acceptor oxidoreductase subunit alpha [Planctomycetes bacterium]|nr:2-oxoacid:acceptor oxidoreductase subunit alpha [Planctomycetota bacterium]